MSDAKWYLAKYQPSGLMGAAIADRLEGDEYEVLYKRIGDRYWWMWDTHSDAAGSLDSVPVEVRDDPHEVDRFTIKEITYEEAFAIML